MEKKFYDVAKDGKVEDLKEILRNNPQRVMSIVVMKMTITTPP